MEWLQIWAFGSRREKCFRTASIGRRLHPFCPLLKQSYFPIACRPPWPAEAHGARVAFIYAVPLIVFFESRGITEEQRARSRLSPFLERPSFPKQSPISDINQRSSGRRQFPALLRHWTASRFSFFINESPLVVFLAQLRGMRVSGVEGSDMDNGGSSSAPGSSADTLKPLQFGRKIYADDDAAAGGSSSKSLTVPALPEVRPSAATWKKAKCAAQGFGQSPPPPMPKCQVEGCDLDLKGSKSYYCRHKVCGMHSKSPKVIVAGLEQRFCQQCSRFHLLKEFDQGKRSCRRRLAGHNERRRKLPPPELLPSRYDHLSSFPDDNGGLHRGYLMDFMHPKPSESSRESLLWPSLRSGDLFAASELALGECIIGVSDSTRALSLLSDQPWGASSAFMSPTNTDQRHPVIGTSVNVESTPPNIASGYLNSLPGFNDHELGSSASHEAGLRQIDDTGNANNQFSSSDVEPIEVYDHLHDLQWLL